MALNAAVGSFAQPGVTGNQAITGVGFTPSVVIFWINDLIADGNTLHGKWTYGAAISSSSRFYTAMAVQSGNAANFNGTRAWTETACVGVVAVGAATTLAEADLVSMDADGFTLNWTTVDATARIVNYCALGGLSSVFIGNIVTTGSGDQSATGVGFTPDALLFASPGINGTPPEITSASPGRYVQGFGSSPSVRGFSSGYWDSASTSSEAYQRTAGITGTTANAGGAVNLHDLVSMDADGFTLHPALNSGTIRQYFIAMKGVQVAVGAINQPSSTGNQSVSGLAGQPFVVWLQSNNAVASSSAFADASFSWGAGVSSASRFAMGALASTGVTTQANSTLDRTKILALATAGIVTPTLNAAADLVSLDGAGFTINWTTVDATAREILYAAFLPLPPPTLTAALQEPVIGSSLF